MKIMGDDMDEMSLMNFCLHNTFIALEWVSTHSGTGIDPISFRRIGYDLFFFTI